ncbi:family 20 glycosylhydrolase [uncultured Bacteroides sp.]|uniref:family 20 glycosylhydrolase n=1 Tax=uncultured Bacteroides sp. TaxID=162156 RepID=UPI0025DCF7D5|nr:family 20 glycosylhydrolase [uncultured Bacteroides sp.]
MKRILSIGLLMVIMIFNLSAVDIVPLPYKVTTTNKKFSLEKDVDYERLLMRKDTSIKSFQIGIRGEKMDRLFQKLGFFKEELGNEGYELFIDNNQVVLAANTPQGLFYGKQSLIQLIRGAQDNTLQGLHIIDKPAVKYRGVMDDISRGPVPTLEYMKYQIRRFAELKINTLTYYTEHVVRTEKHPEFAPPGGALSIAEWKELSEYAKEYYIELIPNFQSLGHAEKVLLCPKFQNIAESNTMYALTKPETLEFMRDIYTEMSPAFESKFFHVNCDETFDIGRGPSSEKVKELGVGRVYTDYMNQLSSILKDNGKRMMMWGDIVLQHPEILDILPKETVMMTWEYSDYDSYSKWIDPFVEKGFDFIVCPGVLNSSRISPNYKMAIPNIQKFIKQGIEKGAIGVLNTVWDEGSLHTFDRDWYGVAYGAEHSWNPNKKELSDFDVRLSKAIYRSEKGELITAIRKLTEMSEIEALDNMSELVFWKTIIPERGKHIKYSLTDWEDVFEACLEVDSILSNPTALNYTREYKAFGMVTAEYKYLAKAKLKLAEAASLYVEAIDIQRQDKIKAKTLLDKVYANITECRNDLAKVQKDYDAIWKAENREYWNNFEMEPFNQLLTDYDDIITSLDKSVGYFEQGLPLIAPADIRLDIRELKNSYFTYWLISPVFNFENGTTFDTDLLKGMGGESTAAPFPGFSFFNDKGENIKWMKYSSSLSDRVSLDIPLEAKGKALSYAYCTLESSEEQIVTASFGFTGKLDIICNGVSVFKKQGSETMITDEYQCKLHLKTGRNRILLKLEKATNNWDFSFRITDAKVSSRKNKYQIY